MELLMNFTDIIKLHNLNPAEFRLIRHGYKEIDPLDVFQNDRKFFDAYQSFQSKSKFKNAKYIASFAPYSIKEFENYESTILTFSDVKNMTDDLTSNLTWYNALKSVNGIYCITDTQNGKLYVGSAYGKQGIWRRWKQYAETGHGGNKLLMDLSRKNPNRIKKFQFSVLEILPATSTPDDAISKENLWKDKLGSRINGYNDN